MDSDDDPSQIRSDGNDEASQQTTRAEKKWKVVTHGVSKMQLEGCVSKSMTRINARLIDLPTAAPNAL